MHTPDCSYCGKRWSYGQTFKQVFKIKMICPHCGKENYYQASKKNAWIPLLAIPVFLVLVLLLKLSSMGIILLGCLLMVLHVFTIPYRTRLQKAGS
ncbi:TIGR04104 family putative zinc finger protein [Oceanobacillus timonensis]|uniref:TIGR04104 family putative zinc finger protein n=1 Tax=Oceanobacillus timonensis TaxID=1926285 RepID=UPI0009BB4DA9|nr:TIGR04104 family putative zinc finger protein [Oceanobacillus timonensis]